jgi:hypothetical protein
MNWRSPLSSLPLALSASGLRRQLHLSTRESIFLGVGIVLFLMVILYYLLQVRPLAEEIAKLENRIKEQRVLFDRQDREQKQQQDQVANAEAILASLRRFESSLKPDQRGMTLLMNEIDQLGKTHRIQVGDASYRLDQATPLTDAEGNPLPNQQGSQEKKLTIYPKMGIDTTVIGDYPNLRRFLADLEKSQQFVILNSLAFQGEADRVRQAAGNPSSLSRLELSSPDSIPVSLKIELETYFQRPATAGVAWQNDSPSASTNAPGMGAKERKAPEAGGSPGKLASQGE